MLYIFDSAEKLLSILPRDNILEAIHKEVLNGENIFRFVMSASDINAEYVREGNLVAFRDLDAYWQVFEIKNITDVHSEIFTRTAYCEHIFYELLDDIVEDKRPSADATAALAGMLENTRWQAGIIDDLGASSTTAYYISALEAVQNVANAWGGELRWRCVITGGVITRYVDLLAQRGSNTGKQFVYSKDILSIEREADSSSVVTALYGRGKGVELESGGYGRRLTFADVVAADKPAGQEWVGNSDALEMWGRNGRHRFDVFIDEEETDAEKLLEKTRIELTKRITPRVTYRMNVVALEELAEYEHEKARIGDLVIVVDREFNPQLLVSARIIEFERDLLDISNANIILGSFAPTIIEATVNTAKHINDMANRPHNTAWLDGKINVLQNAIESAMSNWWTDENGNLIFEAQDGLSAMKLAGEGFAIANQKNGDGTWNWRTFGTGAGFNADLMTTGILDAALVQIGHATTFESGYDPTQIVAGSSVGMGVDSDCLGLWHFDGSLNSHKGVAVETDGAFDTGCFGQAVKVEEGTTNLISSPRWYGSIGGVNPTVYSNYHWKIDATANADGQYVYYYPVFNVTQNTDYTFSFKVINALLPTTAFFKIAAGNNGTVITQKNLAISDIGKTVSVTANSGSNTQITIAIFVPANNGQRAVFEADYMQLEKKNHATSFVDGTRLGVLKASTTGLSPSQGTINFRAKNLDTSSNGSVLLDLPKSDNTQGLQAGISSATGHEGEVYITDSPKVSKSYTETSQADFNSGTLTDVVTTSAGDLELAFGYIDTTAAMTSDTTPVPNKVTASHYYDIYYPYLAFDKSSGSYWYSGLPADSQEWIKYDYGNGNAKTITKISLLPLEITAGGRSIRDWAIYGSNDDTNWAKLGSGTRANSLDKTTHLFNNNIAYQYYKLEMNGYHPVYPYLTGACEIELMETTYKSSGTRIKEVDLSGANPAGGTKIEWSKTTPTGTSIKVETALSTDGGSTYGAYQEATSGSSIPDITAQTDLTNARLKIKETLSTTDTSVTPRLHSLSFTIWEKQATTVYGPNKSTLTAWDSISLAWKSDRLSLVVNDAEACYIENPGLPSALGSHVFICTDRNGANAINTLVDELRIDKVYREVNIRAGWHKAGVPFYTSEDMKQWPGYLRAETDGLKVYDSSNALRVLLGSWLRDAVRRYGIKIIEGELYSSIISTGAEDSLVSCIKLYNESLNGVLSQFGYTGKEILRLTSTGDQAIFKFLPAERSGAGLATMSLDANNKLYFSGYNGIVLSGNTHVNGDLTLSGGTKYNVEQTMNYGQRKLTVRESPTEQYIDEGMGMIVDGECKITIESIFLECIEPHTPDSRWYITLTPYGKAILYVDEIGDDYFIVKDYNDNANGIEFTWSLSATRKNCSKIRLLEVVS